MQSPQNVRVKRLVLKKEAAIYLGVSTTTFDKICPILPKTFGTVVRYDLNEIDRWLDGAGGEFDAEPEWKARLSA